MISLALSKGRILDECLGLLGSAGLAPRDPEAAGRSLVLASTDPGVRLMVLRAHDVPTFVARGAAEAGIAGKDVLLERSGAGLYEPLDLGIARCRLVIAAPAGMRLPARPRVATKYVASARRHFAARGVQAEVIRLYGSMEIAPAAGLADCICDLVASGRTLAANGLVELEEVAAVSARLIVNPAAMKIRHAAMAELIARIEAARGEAREVA